MRTSLIRQFGVYVATSLFACFGICACSDDSSNSGKAEDKTCTEAKIKECTDDGKVCKNGECVKGEEDLCTEAKTKECTDDGKVCKNGECVPNEQDLCTQEKIAECAQTNRDCKNGTCVPKADPCTQEKIDECTNQGKICENGECAPKAVLSVTPSNEIPLVAYNLSMNEQDSIIPASYQFCYKLDTKPTGDVTLSFEKSGTSKDYIGIEPATLTLNAENYNANTNCITVSDLNDGEPGKTNVGDKIQITATTASSQISFANLTANSTVELKDSYEYNLQLSQTEIELNEMDEPVFGIDIRLLAAPESDTNHVQIHSEVSCGEQSNVTISTNGIVKPHTDENINNVYSKTNMDVHWAAFKTFKFQLHKNDTINIPEEHCTITFSTQTEDQHYVDMSRVVNISIIDDAH